ncbi:MAG: type III pantothenate kinase [Leptospirillia bacterium]
MSRADHILLAVDAGNTHVNFGVFAGERLAATGKLAHGDVAQLADAVRQAFPQGGVTAAGVASVVPSLNQRLAEGCRQVTGNDPQFFYHTSNLGLGFKVDRPEAVGADRLVNAAGAFHLFGGPLVVVDAGTAITVCAVNAAGDFLGGAIAPGPGLALKALTDGAEQLPVVEIKSPARAVGRNTDEAMRAGVVIGCAGLIDRLAGEAAGEAANTGKAPVYLTGGQAGLLSPYLKVTHKEVPHLTLKALRLLLERGR